MKSPFLKSAILFAFSGILLLSACDKVEDALTKDIEVKNIKLNITTPVTDSDLRSDLLPFGGEITIDYNDPQLKDFKSYLSLIDKIQVDEVIIISTTDGDGTIVKDFNLTSAKVGVNYTIPSYEFGKEYVDTKLPAITKDILNAVLNKEVVDLKITGLSDEKAGKNLKHQIWIKKGFIRVKLI